MIKFLADKRLSIIDWICLSVAWYQLYLGEVASFFMVVVVGALISVLAERHVNRNLKGE